MSESIKKRGFLNRRGFTLAEILIAAIIGTMVIASAWSVYVMVWQWWAETSPRLDVERKARLALLQVIEGVQDSTTGTFTVGSITYKRRNGIAWATAYPDIYTSSGTIISDTCHRDTCNDDDCVGVKIRYKLNPDSSNIREFYVGSYNGHEAIYYKDSNGTAHRLDNTLSDNVDLKFERLSAIQYISGGAPQCKYIYDKFGIQTCLKNVIIVTVTVSDDVLGTRKNQPYTESVTYADTVYLRSTPNDPNL